MVVSVNEKCMLHRKILKRVAHNPFATFHLTYFWKILLTSKFILLLNSTFQSEKAICAYKYASEYVHNHFPQTSVIYWFSSMFGSLCFTHTHTYTQMPSDIHEQEFVFHLKPKNKIIGWKKEIIKFSNSFSCTWSPQWEDISNRDSWTDSQI